MALVIQDVRLVRTVHEGNAEATITVKLTGNVANFDSGSEVQIPVREARSPLVMWTRYDRLPSEVQTKVAAIVRKKYQRAYQEMFKEPFPFGELSGSPTLRTLKVWAEYTSHTPEPELSPSITIGDALHLQFIALGRPIRIALGAVVGISQLEPSLS